MEGNSTSFDLFVPISTEIWNTVPGGLGDKAPGNKLPGQRKVWKKDKVHSFPRVRGRSLVLSKCKLITKRGRDNSEGNSKKP